MASEFRPQNVNPYTQPTRTKNTNRITESADANTGYMQQEFTMVQSSAHPVPLALYEVNLHTTDGSMPQATLNIFTPSIGAGIANANHMLMMLRNQGSGTYPRGRDRSTPGKLRGE